jgi:hypothetical protein
MSKWMTRTDLSLELRTKATSLDYKPICLGPVINQLSPKTNIEQDRLACK